MTIADLIKTIKSVDKTRFKLQPHHFSSIKGLTLSFNVNDFVFSMRDYYKKLIHLKKLDFGGFIINAVLNENSFQSDLGSLKKLYYSLALNFTGLECGYGLCYSPATNEIIDWVRKCIQQMKKAQNSHANINPINVPESLNNSNNFNKNKSWDVMRYKNHGVFEVSIPRKLKLSFMTSLSPHSAESLVMTLQNFHLLYQHNLQITCQKIMIKRSPRPQEEGHALNIPRIEILFRLKWSANGDPMNHYVNLIDHDRNLLLHPADDFKARNLEISVSINVPYGKDLKIEETKKLQLANDRNKLSRYIAKNSGSPFIYAQTEFINWLLNLPSLRYDMLRLYKINVDKYSEDGEPTNEDMVYSDYLELIKHTLNSQLNQDSEPGKFVDLLSGVNLKLHIGGTRLVYSNLKNPMTVEVPNDANILDDKQQEKKILGLQGVIDTITFSCCFYQKQNALNAETLRKLSKKKRNRKNILKKVWKVKEGLGKLHLMYMSTFNGLELLDLKPKEFEALRKNTYQVSLDNPQVFREFFNLGNSGDGEFSKKGAQSLIFSLGSPPKVQPVRLIRATSFEDPLATPTTALKNIRRRHFSFAETALVRTASDSSCLLDVLPSLNDIQEEEENDKSMENKLQDFEYSGIGIFFKADMLVYEQVRTNWEVEISLIFLCRIKWQQ